MNIKDNMNKIEDYSLPEGRSLGLKVVLSGGRPEHEDAPKEFKGWNLELGGLTEAPDWDSTPDFGGGLHVWEWAQGTLELSRIWEKFVVVWLAVEYETSKAVDLTDLVKVPRCKTIAVSSDRREIVSFIKKFMPPEKKQFPILFDEKEVEEGEVEVGDGGTAKTGDGGFACAGYKGIAEAGAQGSACVGRGGTAIAGFEGYANACEGSTAIAGNRGTAIVGIETITGEGGCAIAGHGGVAEAGKRCTAKVGLGGKAKAGKGGKLIFALGLTQSKFVEFSKARYQEALEARKTAISIGAHSDSFVVSLPKPPKCAIVCDDNGSPTELVVYVNFDGIKPDTFYTLDDSGIPVEAGE